jgi:hypothetical protein
MILLYLLHAVDGDSVLNPNATSSASPTASTGAPAFSGASSVSDVPFTSGVATPTSSISGGAAIATSSSSKAGAIPMATGAISIGALFGAGAVLVNLQIIG